ncbi:hypothetical protein EYF80_057448 [Liparis tanakae]|uniref:Uncharacterized protein n=1 Tax=Liparis tanakae TaxID=230148 RepID=A0A4Z2EV21_9TELE|nr:hypothetical protein EYF80_057448 [Liparis tanakae]
MAVTSHLARGARGARLAESGGERASSAKLERCDPRGAFRDMQRAPCSASAARLPVLSQQEVALAGRGAFVDIATEATLFLLLGLQENL